MRCSIFCGIGGRLWVGRQVPEQPGGRELTAQFSTWRTDKWWWWTCLPWTAAKMNNRSWVICTSEKALSGEGCLSMLTDKSVGVALLAPAFMMGPGGGGMVCSKAWMRSVRRAFEPVATCHAEANSAKSQQLVKLHGCWTNCFGKTTISGWMRHNKIRKPCTLAKRNSLIA